MTKRIVALDPGGTTGWAMYTDGPAWLTMPEVEKFTCGQIAEKDHHLLLYNQLGHWQTHDFVIVCESFEFRQHDDFRTGVVLDSKEYIGVVKLFGQERKAPVVFQTAGHAKGFIPDKAKNGLPANAKLKAMGLYFPGQKHAMDAMRHLVTYMVQVEGRVDLTKSWRNL